MRTHPEIDTTNQEGMGLEKLGPLDLVYPELRNVIYIYDRYVAFIGVKFGLMVLLLVKKLSFFNSLWIFSRFGTTDFFLGKDAWRTDK